MNEIARVLSAHFLMLNSLDIPEVQVLLWVQG